ncbi:queuine tRNA-ribosyltransferase [Clostridia bacterium]|nr:queuine tRNA-ribosyltransferase [Clostridia bacterium]
MFTLLSWENNARRGTLHTSRGDIQTPAFMNVATQAAIKGALSGDDLETAGCQVALCNTYHLHLRPGDEIVRDLGGLHNFMRWNRPILTDSGGFQVFSLAGLRKITEEGVTFASHIDGRRIFMRPEDSIRIQQNLGSDIAMAFDECVANPSPREYVSASADRTVRWLERCKTAHKARHNSESQQLWGINQGGVYADIRARNMREIARLDLDGYAIGGLAVGETAEEMYAMIEVVEQFMPTEKPRYLMGVGTPTNILEAVSRGVDIFDCVMPARNARHGHLFTSHGQLNLNNEKYKTDPSPIDDNCGCPLCKNYSRAYLRHLFRAGEMLAMRLAVMHNLWFYNDLMAKIRTTIEENRFAAFRDASIGVFDKRA